MPDLNCLEDNPQIIQPDLPTNMLWDAAPSASIPSGVFVQVPIEADDAGWRHDAAGLAGRIQQDVANQQLVVTEQGVYTGWAGFRVNRTSALTVPGGEPSLFEIQVRVNGTPVRELVRRSPDGWDLNSDTGIALPFNYGLVMSFPFSIFLNPGDTVQLWARVTALLGGSFPRQLEPNYGMIEMTKLGNVPSALPGSAIDCEDARPVVTSQMQATFMQRSTSLTVAEPNPVVPAVNEVPAEWTEVIDEGGDGLGADLIDWNYLGFPQSYAMTLAATAGISIWRHSMDFLYEPAPASSQVNWWNANTYEGRPNATFGGTNKGQKRLHSGLPNVVNEGFGGGCESSGIAAYIGPGQATNFQEWPTLQQPPATLTYNVDRCCVSVLTIEVAP